MPARRQTFGGHRVLLLYKDYWYDYPQYALMSHLTRNFANIRLLRFSSEERPRGRPIASSPKLFRAIEAWRPTLVVTYNNLLTLAEAEKIRSAGIQIASFINGIHSFFSGAATTQPEAFRIFKLYNCYLVPHAPHIAKLREEGVEAFELPFWNDPEWFHPLANVGKKYDLLFVGDFGTILNRNRAELLRILAEKYHVAVASDRKPDHERITHIGRTDDPIQLNRWFNQARVVIGSDRLGDTSTLNSIPDQYIKYEDEFFIRERVYLALGAGCCYVTDDHPEIRRKFEDGREIVLWDDPSQLMDKVEMLLRDPARASRTGRDAARRCQLEHSTARRVQEILKILAA